MFIEKFGRQPPPKNGIYKMLEKLKSEFTLRDLRKGNSGRKFTMRTPTNIASVRMSLDKFLTRQPGRLGPSARRLNEPISKSSYNRITKIDHRLKPYKILRLHKVTNQQEDARLKMGRLLMRKPLSWFKDLCVSDKAWFTLSGHVFNRQNTVCYATTSQGTPDQWTSSAS